MTLFVDLRDRLRELRERAGLRQEDLAKRLDKHQTWVSRVERGKQIIRPDDALDWAEECDAIGAIVFLPREDGAGDVIELLTTSPPADLRIASKLLHALPRMIPARREMLVAMLETALDV